VIDDLAPIYMSSFQTKWLSSGYIAVTFEIKDVSECVTHTQYLWLHIIVSTLSDYYQYLCVSILCDVYWVCFVYSFEVHN
jgi:hypothetical protein